MIAAGFMDAEGKADRKPYALRHTFATFCLAEGMNTFSLSRVMGTSVQMIDRTYGHFLPDADQAILNGMEQFDARASDHQEATSAAEADQ